MELKHGLILVQITCLHNMHLPWTFEDFSYAQILKIVCTKINFHKLFGVCSWNRWNLQWDTTSHLLEYLLSRTMKKKRRKVSSIGNDVESWNSWPLGLENGAPTYGSRWLFPPSWVSNHRWARTAQPPCAPRLPQELTQAPRRLHTPEPDSQNTPHQPPTVPQLNNKCYNAMDPEAQCRVRGYQIYFT